MKISLLCFLFIFSTFYAHADNKVRISESSYDYKCVNTDDMDLFSVIYLKKNENCRDCYDLQLRDGSDELVGAMQVEKQSRAYTGGHFRGSSSETSIIWLDDYMSGYRGLTGHDATFFYVKDKTELFNGTVYCKHKDENQSNI